MAGCSCSAAHRVGQGGGRGGAQATCHAAGGHEGLGGVLQPAQAEAGGCGLEPARPAACRAVWLAAAQPLQDRQRAGAQGSSAAQVPPPAVTGLHCLVTCRGTPGRKGSCLAGCRPAPKPAPLVSGTGHLGTGVPACCCRAACQGCAGCPGMEASAAVSCAAGVAGGSHAQGSEAVQGSRGCFACRQVAGGQHAGSLGRGGGSCTPVAC
mmetsp:Transcript_10863/g.23395  ORF Transcript_10863/g.23395 Transcript_10863/m.23395 type:complete len:209 (+) Transcript_10863:52-678(+)